MIKTIIKMTAKAAIKIINRRAATLAKLFGVHSDIYEAFTTQLTEFNFYEKNGVFQLENSAANRKFYRQLVPWAKRIQKTPYAVLKRKSDKLKKSIMEDKEFFDGVFEDDIIDLDTYYKWLSHHKDYFDSCYTLANMEGYHSMEAYHRAEELYNDRNDYVHTWNTFYEYGKFDEFKKNYERDVTEQLFDIDEETGEAIPKPEFYRGL